MIKSFISIFFFLFLTINTPAANLKLSKKDDVLVVHAFLDSIYDIKYVFKRCMSNKLFTFYEVSFVPKEMEGNGLNKSFEHKEYVVNKSVSDNIGPFLLKDSGWTGGNHLYQDSILTAEHRYYQIWADGNLISSDTSLICDELVIKVKQDLFDPKLLPRRNSLFYKDLIFCEESVNYLVKGNSIQVTVNHDYKNKEELIVERYYGAQSMFIDESMILTPYGAYSNWCNVADVNRFFKAEYPSFNRYIERGNNAYQSIYLLNEGLGNHNQLNNADIVFIGNSYSKSYHNLVSNRVRKGNDYDSWTAVYTWFRTAFVDRSNIFSYFGVLYGKPVWYIDCLEALDYDMPIPSDLENENLYAAFLDPLIEFERKGKNIINIKSKTSGSVIFTW